MLKHVALSQSEQRAVGKKRPFLHTPWTCDNIISFNWDFISVYARRVYDLLVLASELLQKQYCVLLPGRNHKIKLVILNSTQNNGQIITKREYMHYYNLWKSISLLLMKLRETL